MNTVVLPCQDFVDCPGSDLPITNFTSEAVDAPLFLGLFWGSQGLGICQSPVDQQTADLCAARDNCITNTSPRFFNNQQSGTVFCLDGSPFTFTAPAGLFCANTQALADSYAVAYATAQAQKRLFCIIPPPVPANLQIGDKYSGSFTTVGAGGTTTYMPVTPMPPGLTLNPNGLVTGTIEQAGNSFCVQGVNENGDFMIKCADINAQGVCPDPGTCLPGECWDTELCECHGFFNDAQTGTLCCPGNPSQCVSGTVPKCTYFSANAGDYPDNLNQMAQNALANMLQENLALIGCPCAPISFNQDTITNNSLCPYTVGVHVPNGNFADPTFHTFTVAAGATAGWCAFIHGLTGNFYPGLKYFDLGNGLKYWFSNCPPS